ncbi:hypothetical protein [Ellagibacter isourolithinifaciens]|uniref:hypothetical protein n=1 Tax=Ellagibacter isourolithinifaciens TaxID=2137581 RepID=UPI003AF054B1
MDRLTNKAIVLACCLAVASGELSGECKDAAEIVKEACELALSLAVEHRKERA